MTIETEPDIVEVCRLPNDATLYREPNGVGGHRYWSDEIGGGVMVWDTSLVDERTLLAAILAENRRIGEEVSRAQDESKGRP